MLLEIVTPEAIIFKSEVDNVVVPGVNGSFQMLNNHAPIISLLGVGDIKIKGSNITLSDSYQDKFEIDKDEYKLSISGGAIEMNHNDIIILVG